MDLLTLPTPEQIQRRIQLCRLEMAELKRMLRAIQAAKKAEEARRARQSVEGKHEGGAPCPA